MECTCVACERLWRVCVCVSAHVRAYVLVGACVCNTHQTLQYFVCVFRLCLRVYMCVCVCVWLVSIRLFAYVCCLRAFMVGVYVVFFACRRMCTWVCMCVWVDTCVCVLSCIYLCLYVCVRAFCLFLNSQGRLRSISLNNRFLSLKIYFCYCTRAGFALSTSTSACME